MSLSLCAFVSEIGRKQVITAAACAGLCLAAVANGQTPKQRLSVSDLFQLQSASNPEISPDGATVAYVRNVDDMMTDKQRASIWIIESATGKQKLLSDAKELQSSPVWSPDGSRLAYVATVDGAARLHVQNLKTDANLLVATVPSGMEGITWSPDGSQIAFLSAIKQERLKLGAPLDKPTGAQWAQPLIFTDDINYRSAADPHSGAQLFVVSSAGGTPRQVTHQDLAYMAPFSWTRDGASIVIAAHDAKLSWFAPTHPINTEVYTVSVADGSATALTTRNGPDYSPQISPDGKKIAYLGFDDVGQVYNIPQLYVMNTDGSDPRRIATSSDLDIQQICWADNTSLYLAYAGRGEERLARMSLDGRLSAPTLLSSSGANWIEPYSGGAEFSVASNGAIAYTGGGVTAPADIYLAPAGKNGKQLTRLNDAVLDSRSLGRMRPIAVKATDGSSIDAWLVTPPGYVEGTKVPLILEIHGGPLAAFGPVFAFKTQLFAAAGYAVVFANPPGSTTYGEDFGNRLRLGDPNGQYDALMRAVDAAVDQGVADPNNLFVEGHSWGGVMTSWVVGKTTRFKAASESDGAVNWMSWWLTNDRPDVYWRGWAKTPVWEDPQGNWARSSLSLVGNVRTPTLVVSGEVDSVVPIGEAEQFYTALKLRGVPSVFATMPAADHNTDRPSQQAEWISAIIAWFDRYRSQS